MQSITKLLQTDSRKRIQNAIEQAEKSTSAEIVPMIVSSSTGTGHVFPILALFNLIITNEIFHFIEVDSFYPLSAEMVFFILSSIAVVLAYYLSRCNSIRRVLTSDKEEFLNVERRAMNEFYEAQMHSTLTKTGVLLFLSMQERKAVVLADKSISDKFDKSVWDEVIKELITGVRNKDLTQGISNSIQKCSDILSKQFPSVPHDKNELPDKLIIKL